MTAAEAPTPTLSDLFSPVEVAVFLPVLVAITLTAPAPMLSALPVPIRATVVWLSSASATEASTAMPPAAPAEA
ncbi:MAG: hypothetical protein CVU17_11795, partial [Betaproteobacteria bacterium HGW-Betaproteobacteria-11]